MGNLAVISLSGVFLAVALAYGGRIYLVGKGMSEKSAMRDLEKKMKMYRVERES